VNYPHTLKPSHPHTLNCQVDALPHLYTLAVKPDSSFEVGVALGHRV